MSGSQVVTTMSAIVQEEYGSADVLQLTQVARPVPGEGEVLVRVRAAGVHVAHWHLMEGTPYLVRAMGFGLRRPKTAILGDDFAGVVERVGGGVTGFQIGDEVFGMCRGAFAEYAIARPHRIAPKPANLTFEQAAVIPMSAVTALQALRDKGRIEPGHRVLVVGAGGGVGTFAVQVAKALGAHVTGVTSPTKLDLVRSLGVDKVVDYTEQDFALGQKYDIVVVTGGNRPLSELRRALLSNGTLVIVGAEGGNRWFGRVGRPVGAALLSPFVPQRMPILFADVRSDDLITLAEMTETGSVTPVIDRTYTLDDTSKALRSLEGGHGRGKVVISL